MVTEMEWKCCHGYSGDDCSDSRGRTTGEEGMALHHLNTRTHKVSQIDLTGCDFENILNSAVFFWNFFVLLLLFLFSSSIKKNA